MTVVFYLNIISPHQLPLAYEVAKRVSVDNFVYIYTEDFHAERANMGWNDKVEGLRVEKLNDANRALLESAEILYTGIRCLDLLERRAVKGLKTYYYSERWFKPFHGLPGWVRMLDPRYFTMARRMARILRNESSVMYLPIGPHAARDMRLLGVPECKMMPWGYFVAPSDKRNNSTVDLDLLSRPSSTRALRVLYVGRLLALKHVDTIIRAVAFANKNLDKLHSATTTPNYNSITLTIVGSGPEESRLKKLASSLQLQLQTTTKSSPSPSTSNLQPVVFLPPVPISEVRSIMRQHDVLVFASDANDGWGAVVNEALSEGVPVIGTYETGAPAALLPDSQLFHCGDWSTLAKKFSTLNPRLSTSTMPQEYTAACAAERLLK